LAHRNKRLLWLIILITFVLYGCGDPSTESPAPGCRKSFGMGGCFGKTVILDVAVEPAVDCLQFEGDNCNGGVLDVKNTCSEKLFFGDATVPAGKFASFDVIEEANGSYELMEIDHNFSALIPQTDKRIIFTRSLGDQEIRILFTKTSELCD